MTTSRPIVYVVDDDFSFREGIDNLLRSVGYATMCFAAVDEFLTYSRPAVPSCVLLDVRMPGKSPLEFQAEMQNANEKLSIVFVTGHGDVPMCARAMKNGAVNFLLKPFREEDLLDAVREGISEDQKRREFERSRSDVVACSQSLSQRERQILLLVSNGRSNKEIARDIGLQEITVKVHRAKAMRKMKSSSVADLVKKLQSIGWSDQ